MARTGITRLRRKGIAGIMGAAAVATAVALSGTASANHPVIVEGNCFGPGAGATATGIQTSPVPAGNCGDVDGDGNIGLAEDADGDNNYGTINAALAAVAQNGRVEIVADGTFPEIVTINPVDGASVVLEARPGVTANVDATVQGQAGGAARLASPGIIINGAANTRVQVRNITSRNWTDGVEVQGSSRVTLDGVLAEGNTDYGVQALGDSRVAITNSQLNGNGFRKTAMGISPANPGTGIEFDGTSRGSIYSTTISGNAAAGISVPAQDRIETVDVQVFDNPVNLQIAP